MTTEERQKLLAAQAALRVAEGSILDALDFIVRAKTHLQEVANPPLPQLKPGQVPEELPKGQERVI